MNFESNAPYLLIVIYTVAIALFVYPLKDKGIPYFYEWNLFLIRKSIFLEKISDRFSGKIFIQSKISSTSTKRISQKITTNLF